LHNEPKAAVNARAFMRMGLREEEPHTVHVRTLFSALKMTFCATDVLLPLAATSELMYRQPQTFVHNLFLILSTKVEM
jgi:hypothetical protein